MSTDQLLRAPARLHDASGPAGGKPAKRRPPGAGWARVRLIAAHVAIYLAALVFISPLIYAFFSALKPNDQVFTQPPSLFGTEIRWSNFMEVFTFGPFLTYIGNSLFVSVLGTILVLFVAATSGYAFARLSWPGRDLVFILFLGTLMVPQEVLVIPMFTLMQWFGWVNTFQGIILPFAFTAFGTFLMRQFFRGIPYELEEAARMDGAGPVRTFFRIILPLSGSALAVLAVFTFLSFWNGYLWPLVVTADYATLGTLPIGLASFASQYQTRWDLQLAASVIAMIPTTILVISLQKHLVRGIATAGLGGR